MKKYILSIIIGCCLCSCGSLSNIDQARAASGLSKIIQASTITDSQMAAYVSEYISQTDANNKVCSESSQYTKRLRKLTSGLNDANGIQLNFKVYNTPEVNAFACPDGSIRIYSGLMDIMTDELEYSAVVIHERKGESRHTRRSIHREETPVYIYPHFSVTQQIQMFMFTRSEQPNKKN